MLDSENVLVHKMELHIQVGTLDPAHCQHLHEGPAHGVHVQIEY